MDDEPMRRWMVAVGTAFLVLLLSAPMAGAAELDGGCQGAATSFDDEGGALSEVAGPGAGGTKREPFLVDPDGTIGYEGSSPEAFHDHSWQVDLMGITVKDGGSENANDESATSGEVDVADYVPVSAVGLFKVSGGISGDEGSCDGSMWVKVVGSPVGTVPWIAGIGAVVVGAAGLATSSVLPLLRKGM